MGQGRWSGRGEGWRRERLGVTYRVGLRSTVFSLCLLVSRFNCLRLIMKQLKTGLSVFCVPVRVSYMYPVVLS